MKKDVKSNKNAGVFVKGGKLDESPRYHFIADKTKNYFAH